MKTTCTAAKAVVAAKTSTRLRRTVNVIIRENVKLIVVMTTSRETMLSTKTKAKIEMTGTSYDSSMQTTLARTTNASCLYSHMLLHSSETGFFKRCPILWWYHGTRLSLRYSASRSLS